MVYPAALACVLVGSYSRVFPLELYDLSVADLKKGKNNLTKQRGHRYLKGPLLSYDSGLDFYALCYARFS